MLPTLISRAATALLVGGKLVRAIDLSIDDPCMRISWEDCFSGVVLTSESSIDQECSRHISLRYDDILPWQSEWWNPRSVARSSAKSADWMYVSRTSEFEVDLLADSRTDYWWESGAMWGSLIDYWHFTGDTSYNSVIEAGIQWQVGEHDDMMPSNWSQSMGNDDQGFWGMTAMTAAETNFQNPPANQPSWLSLAQAVFNTQAERLAIETLCGGG